MSLPDEPEHLLQGRHLQPPESRMKPTACIERPDLCQGQVSDLSDAVGRSIDRVVMDDHQLSVPGLIHVQFDRCIQSDCCLESRQCIFRRVTDKSAMSKQDRFDPAEVRLSHGQRSRD